MLFNRFFFDGKAILTSSPNNPGIEVEPILHSGSNERISFQAKYFTDNVHYDSVERSMTAAIQNYGGSIDVIYLYCNKDFTYTATSFTRFKAALRDAGIRLETVTNVEILNQIIGNQYAVIAARYFANESLSKVWFEEKAELALRGLGLRYNCKFNVPVEYEKSIDKFLFLQEAIEEINTKKRDVKKEIQKTRSSLSVYKDFIDETLHRITALPDVTQRSIHQCLGWWDAITSGQNPMLDTINARLDELYSIAYSAKEESEKHALQNELSRTRNLIGAIDNIDFSQAEQALIKNKVLILKGAAGSGKSHLLGTITESRISNGIPAVLLLGQSLLSDENVEQQIIQQLGLDCTFTDFIDILDGIGIETEQQVALIVDAVNESSNTNIWKNGLSRLLQTIEAHQNVKLIISVRNGYEPLVFSEDILGRIREGSVAQVIHDGFYENTMEATMQFFDYYNIKFGVSELLQHEFSNPLMLKLYCETKASNPKSMFEMFEAYIKHVDVESKKSIGLDSEVNLLINLVLEIADCFINTGTERISLNDILSLSFWSTYGILDKMTYIETLTRLGFFSRFAWKDDSDGLSKEAYYFAYQKLADYYTALAMMRASDDEEKLRKYIQNSVLKVENGRITHWAYRGVFTMLCGLFPQEYHKECIDILDSLEHPDVSLLCEYIESFSWRSPEHIDPKALIDFVNEHNYLGVSEAFINLLLNMNSVVGHPLSSEFLHSLLFKMELNKRDYIWTTRINRLDSENRVYHLAELIQKGEHTESFSQDEKQLFAVVCSWLLSSSNRMLRDNVSECLIELLRNEPQICICLLNMFSGVNDPYIIQRLYGVVFGVCMQSDSITEADFLALSEQVYENIFDVEYVYPDILLRDYARLTIERFIYQYPSASTKINVSKIRPPYHSEAIPDVEKNDYYDKDKHGGLSSIVWSMSPDIRSCGVGMYGDFGRYVWQSSMDDFEGIDAAEIEKLFYYTMYYIVEELGYMDELFDEYDTNVKRYGWSRHETKKIERIGKKYQWISYYNVLARLFDTRKASDYEGWEKYVTYQGAWNPYVRDFDPTLNTRRPRSVELPAIGTPYALVDIAWIPGNSTSEAERDKWVATASPFFEKHETNLIVKSEDKEWIALYQYCHQKSDADAERDAFDERTAQDIWSMSFGYLASFNDAEKILNHFESTSFQRNQFPEGRSIYELFNKEYSWSPGFKDVLADEWCLLGDDMRELYDDDDEKLAACKIMPAYIDFLWEEQFDASQDEAVGFNIPCGKIIEELELHQKTDCGLFYNGDDLVAFENRTEGFDVDTSLFIRKDYIERFLSENNLSLFWLCIGEKQSFLANKSLGDPKKQKWSSWNGVYKLEVGNVIGDFRKNEGETQNG
jgi:hypothetical protein